MNKILIAGLILLAATSIFGQDRNYEIGSRMEGLQNNRGAYYDYSDPEAINMKVSVWGYVRYPGRYNIPTYTTAKDLLSYAGGPTTEANLDDIRLYKTRDDSTSNMIKFDLNDMMWEDSLKNKNQKIPKLEAGDILVVPGTDRLFFTDWFNISLRVFSALISLSILILNITRN